MGEETGRDRWWWQRKGRIRKKQLKGVVILSLFKELLSGLLRWIWSGL